MAQVSRQYRPTKFSEISGQTRAKETLRKEVEQNKLGHAYLFSGPRGVGKTTAARIFAKAVNCLQAQDGEPCLTCENCKTIAEGAALDVIEIDAASNNGVENVRGAIIEHIRFVPAKLKYKVYILDEAHMLSTAAWNAMLKTIEEPPNYAIFIFATTERHKVPATIASRCQRLEFTRLTDAETVSRIMMLAKAENIHIEDDVAKDIASRSEGCLRDAENLFGQLIGLGEKEIGRDIASLVFAPSQMDLAVVLLQKCSNFDPAGVLTTLDDAQSNGADFPELFQDLLSAVRSLLAAGQLKTEEEKLKNGKTEEKSLANLVNKIPATSLIKLSLNLMERRREVKNGLDARFGLELGLMPAALGMLEGHRPLESTSYTKKPELPAINMEQKPDNKQETVTDITIETKQTMEAREIEIDKVISAWPKLLGSLESNVSLVLILKLAKPVKVEGRKVYIKFQYPFHEKKIMKDVVIQKLVEDKLNAVLETESYTIGPSYDEVTENGTMEKKPETTLGKLMDAFGG